MSTNRLRDISHCHMPLILIYIMVCVCVGGLVCVSVCLCVCLCLYEWMYKEAVDSIHTFLVITFAKVIFIFGSDKDFQWV